MRDFGSNLVPAKHRRRIGGVLVALSLLTVFSLGTAGAEGRAVDGAPGAGDPYFPKLGNSGYDVEHYDVTLRIDPKRKSMRGTTGIELKPTVALRSFTLDFIGFDVTGVRVNGAKARFERDGAELRITPAKTLDKGREAVVSVSYKGSPKNSSKDGGWIWFENGGALFSPEPSGTRTLFPCSDHPKDKASFSYDLTTPQGITPVANGLPTRMNAPDGFRRIAWDEPVPFPTYAAVVAVGEFDLRSETTPDGLEIINALPPEHADRLEDRLSDQDDIVSFFEDRFGPYPYSGMGAIVTSPTRPDEMEAAGRPTYTGIKWALKSDEFEQVVAHEIAHQWLGNSATITSWRDIWLNEGFATYAELMWIAHERDVPISKLLRRDSDVFAYPPETAKILPGKPGPNGIFSYSVYNRGALTLEALRLEVGDEDFDEIMYRWTSQNRNSSVTTSEFIRLSESVSGKELDGFFHRWLYEKKLPKLPNSSG